MAPSIFSVHVPRVLLLPQMRNPWEAYGRLNFWLLLRPDDCLVLRTPCDETASERRLRNSTKTQHHAKEKSWSLKRLFHQTASLKLGSSHRPKMHPRCSEMKGGNSTSKEAGISQALFSQALLIVLSEIAEPINLHRCNQRRWVFEVQPRHQVLRNIEKR